MKPPLVVSVSVVAVLLVGLAAPAAVYAQQTKVSAGPIGWWNDPGSWIPAGVPTLDDIAIVQAGHRMHVQIAAAARAIVNNGIIDHPQGHITSDRRVTVLLMVGAVDSLINNGEIYGYNALGGAMDPNEIVPTSVLLTVTGDLWVPPPERPDGRLVNRGIIRAGDAYTRRGGWGSGWSSGIRVPGGSVGARGRPRGWGGLYPDIRFENEGDIVAGRGETWRVSFAGNAVVGVSRWGGYRPFSEVLNRGRVSGGAFGPLGGSAFLFSWNTWDGGIIDGDGGHLIAGEDVTTGFCTWAAADNISLSGPGTLVSGALFELMEGWGWWWWWQSSFISLTDLDWGAVHARRGDVPPFDQLGGYVSTIATDTDMQGNAPPDIVLRAELGPSPSFPGDIVVATRNLMLDPGVTLPMITDPPVDPWIWDRERGEPLAGSGSPRNDFFDACVAIAPAGTPPDTTLAGVPGHGMASPGDTASIWVQILSNQRLTGGIEVTASDSLGFPILNGFQIVMHDTIPLSTVRFDIRVPYWAEIGMVDRIDVRATPQDNPYFYHEIPLHLYVVPTMNVLAPFSMDGFHVEPSNEIIVEYVVRNEGKQPAECFLDAFDTASWDINLEFGYCWLDARSDTVVPVHIVAPSWVSPGDVDTIYVGAHTPSRSMNRDEAYVVAQVVSTGVEELEVPKGARLAQNIPNPFNPKTKICFTLPLGDRVDLDIYDVSGRLVRSLIPGEELVEGDHRIAWDGTNEQGLRVPSGVYFYRLKTGSYEETRRMALVK